MVDVTGDIGVAATGQGNAASSHGFQNPKGAHLLDKGRDLALVARDFKGQGVAAHVHDAGAEIFSDLAHLDAGFGRNGDLDQHQFAVNKFL